MGELGGREVQGVTSRQGGFYGGPIANISGYNFDIQPGYIFQAACSSGQHPDLMSLAE